MKNLKFLFYQEECVKLSAKTSLRFFYLIQVFNFLIFLVFWKTLETEQFLIIKRIIRESFFESFSICKENLKAFSLVNLIVNLPTVNLT